MIENMIDNEHINKIQNDLKIMHQRLDDYILLRSRYAGYFDSKSYDYDKTFELPGKVIWSCWLQGIENAPELVKSCHNALKGKFSGYDKILITADNFDKYVKIDPGIIEKWKAGIISNTAFSNIIRLELLINHGGLWLDSTVLFTGDVMPDFISKSPLFVYSNWKWISGDVRPISTWLMSSGMNHIILKTVRDLLVNYWHDNNELVTYFIFHMFFEMVIEKFPEVWRQTPKISNLPPHMMQFEMDQLYSGLRFEQLKEMSMFHKLTYRVPETTVLNEKNLYNYIIKNY